ncbi:MAG: carboxymuconolactone decarboxylase family protein [Pseudomonadota bacterium]
MATPTIHDETTAPEAARPLLDNSKRAFGRIPNLHGVMASSPAHLEAYQTLHRTVIENTAFTPTERTVVWMAINVEHECHYCVPAHTAIAHMDSIDPKIIEALRTTAPLGDAKLEALRDFTLTVLRARGRVSDAELTAFKAAGYEDRHVLDVLLILAQKVMSNYTNHIYDTPVDAAFQKFDWTPNTAKAA